MKFFPVLLAIILIASCKNKGGQPEPAANTGTGPDTTQARDSAIYLPVTDLLRQDFLRVDSFAGGILKKTTINGKKDSVFIKPQAFHQAASVFFMPELEKSTFRRSFTENSFMDETTGLLQFMYTPNSPSNTLRNVVVYVSPSTTIDQVNRFYFEKEWMAGDTLIQQKLTWKARQYCYIITMRQPKQGAPTTSIEKLIWDPEYFGE